MLADGDNRPYIGGNFELIPEHSTFEVMDFLPPDCKAILLVGEANFSFSVSIIKHVGKDTKVTATSFETEADVKQKLQGGDNVIVLKKNGAEVLYEIDATRLHETSYLSSSLFDVIIFNFPHTGRKGSIKKNRELLKNFFTSCSRVLKPNGLVLVSLCNGQGGTPMDTPQRKWNNSWQIVAMAAFGRLILTGAVTLETVLSNDYCNTGYRGQNKSFHAEGAILHTFQKGLPLTMTSPALKSSTSMCGCGHRPHIPAELTHFFNRNLMKLPEHPLNITRNKLLLAFKETISELQEIEILPNVVTQQSKTLCSSEYVVEFTTRHDCRNQDERLEGEQKEHVNVVIEQSDEADINVRKTSQTNDVSACRVHKLTCSLLQHIPCILGTNPVHPTCVTSEVYHRCLIARDLQVLPVMHQMIMLLPQQCSPVLGDDLMETVSHVIKLVLGDEWCTVAEPIEIFEENSKCDNSSGSYNIYQHALCGLPDSVLVNSVSSMAISCSETSSYVGICGQITSSMKTAKFVLLTLDHVIMHRFNINDIRILWSEDPRQWKTQSGQVLSTFRDGSVSNFSLNLALEPYSKFPPIYVHDLSFWLKPDVSFDELKFYSIVRDLTGLLLEDVKLVDSYTDETTGQCSRCYRFVYKSIDRALTRDESVQLQLNVRESVSKELGLILR